MSYEPIHIELEKNGSPKAKFYTDEDRRALRDEIPSHPDFFMEKVDIERENISFIYDFLNADKSPKRSNTWQEISQIEN